ncbi:hypothetical protein BP5796_02998 [Coleophoma crateriformis]|uniref:Filamentation protein-like protein n=1 Tax=Coleophoma crateriformis TaxID=565419 RepID=A0A3D8SM92_9HELO|nr:hypothetical protein BP5796_02998 [Coleophoma crateriformis]
MSSHSRPQTTNNARSDALSTYIPQLAEVVERERSHVEDAFQAQVCLAWLHWVMGEQTLAASKLPRSIDEEYAQLDGTGKESAQWTRVCVLKASYIKGSAQSRMGQVAEAIETFELALPILAGVSVPAKNGSEIKSWSEYLLTAFCLTSRNAIKSRHTSTYETEGLSAFRAWARFWEGQGSGLMGGRAEEAEVYRRHVWKEYYVTMSEMLQQGLPYPTTALAPSYTNTSTRLQQKAELKSVEARYETLLLREVSFPKADQASDEVESFVEHVMRNWQVLCGSDWQEQDLGEGGSESVSRGVLDVLYRAATRTFHSTAILRDLFTVHLAVADFDLAFKAFDTYLEIVKKGKARVEKTGEPEHGLDDDETVLKTASECIRALCRYGSRDDAEKARDIAHYFEEWLDKHHPEEGSAQTNGDNYFENGANLDLGTKITPQMFAMAWRCIGIGHANWARLTYDASSRGDIQLQAIKCYRRALSPEYKSSADVETLFALAILLAERRELGPAVDAVKAALLPPKSKDKSPFQGPYGGRFARERSLIPLWHLLALLLSARQEFITAARACEGAFEQFQDPRNLFGDADINGSFRSDHLNEKFSPVRGIVDEMNDFEKENVLEVKMTQLALVEVLEGPEVAVNASDELLSLYSRLFGDPQNAIATAAPPKILAPPQSSAGTMRSIKGSIFGRASRKSIRRSVLPSSTIGEQPASQTRPQTMQTIASQAPTISVTNENGENGDKPKKHHLGVKDHPAQHHGKLEKRAASTSRNKSTERRRDRSASRPRATSRGPIPTTVSGEALSTPPAANDNQQWVGDDARASQVGLAISPEDSDISEGGAITINANKSLPPVTQNMSQKEKPMQSVPQKQDTRLPNPIHSSSNNPVTRFPKTQVSRRRSGILVKVWLLISAFYRRASMYDDARGALDEAVQIVRSLENDVMKDTTGKVSITHAGWGGGKSVSALWGDVLADRGDLAIADNSPHLALENFEAALTHSADHPSAIIGLSNLLLDIYTQVLPPAPVVPAADVPGSTVGHSASTTNTNLSTSDTLTGTKSTISLPSSTLPSRPGPLGIATFGAPTMSNPPQLASPMASETAELDRLAARDRAYGLLSSLTKQGSGWNSSEAWFALARAYEEGGQVDKAREVLWWCVELEEGRAVRGWDIFEGYIL